MCFEKADVHLVYPVLDFERLLEFLESHDVELGGRYEQGSVWHDVGDEIEIDPDALSVKVHSHRWINPYAKAESVLLCGYRLCLSDRAFDWIAGSPRFDLETAWRELGVLERECLGREIHGWPDRTV